MPFETLDILFYYLQNDNSYPSKFSSQEKEDLMIVDYYPDEDSSICEDNSPGLSVECDLLAGFSGNKGNHFLRIVFS